MILIAKLLNMNCNNQTNFWQNIFADNIVEKKDDFLQTFSTECHYVKYAESAICLYVFTYSVYDAGYYF